mmetsp:Transcript_45310/g.98585  ORF Transcript_45310/g.98585 Transcript_45310/m.98585 type:complete len:100 (+) Transcript_45310:355-654(+)
MRCDLLCATGMQSLEPIRPMRKHGLGTHDRIATSYCSTYPTCTRGRKASEVFSLFGTQLPGLVSQATSGRAARAIAAGLWAVAADGSLAPVLSSRVQTC